jgi:hypothetical protein
VSAEPVIRDLRAAPLASDWTVDELAERLLSAVAEFRSNDAQEIVFDAAQTADRQTRRLLRPLLACLALKYATEAGATPDVYGGQISFKRQGHDGPVLVAGEFANRPGTVRVVLRRSSAASPNLEAPSELPVPAHKLV